MEKNWKKEIARDTMALGSIPFFIIVMIRVTIGQFTSIFYQLFIALILILLLSYFYKEYNAHIARGLILVVFTIKFYNDALFSVFAFLLWGLMIISAYYIKIKKSEIIKGALFGTFTALITYFISLLI